MNRVKGKVALVTGAGKHQHRPARVHHDRELLGVELARVVHLAALSRRGFDRDAARHGFVGHAVSIAQGRRPTLRQDTDPCECTSESARRRAQARSR